MTLTSQQNTALKNFINADPVLSLKPLNSDGAFDIALALNQQFAPNFTVWKAMVSINLIGKTFDASELGGLTTANQSRLQTLAMYLAGGVDPSQASNRAFFDDIFSGAGGSTTRPKLLALWKRFATIYERVLSTGNGTDVSPATFGVDVEGNPIQGNVSPAIVQTARNS